MWIKKQYTKVSTDQYHIVIGRTFQGIFVRFSRYMMTPWERESKPIISTKSGQSYVSEYGMPRLLAQMSILECVAAKVHLVSQTMHI